MDFSEALHRVKTGHRITRSGWNGKDQWVAYSPGFDIEEYSVFSPAISRDLIRRGAMGHFLPYLMIRTVAGSFVPWLASQTDILAEDWEDLGE